MAPEQTRASKDTWTRARTSGRLGLTLYKEAAPCGELAVRRDDGALGLEPRNRAPRSAPSATGSQGLSPDLAAIVHRYLSKDPAGRPADARALAAALAPFAGERAPVRRPSDPLDLSLSDENVEVVRQGASARDRLLALTSAARCSSQRWPRGSLKRCSSSRRPRGPRAPAASEASKGGNAAPAAPTLAPTTAPTAPTDNRSAITSATPTASLPSTLVTTEAARDTPTSRRSAGRAPPCTAAAARGQVDHPKEAPRKRLPARPSPEDDDQDHE